jgi:Flp pilus assembly pilin Flp
MPRRRIGSDAGSELLEYALIGAVIALASYAALQGVRASVGTAYRTWNVNIRNLAAPAVAGAVGGS